MKRSTRKRRATLAALVMGMTMASTGCQYYSGPHILCGIGNQGGTFYVLEPIPEGAHWIIPGILGAYCIPGL